MNYKNYFPLGRYLKPSAEFGDMYSQFPEKLKHFNFEYCNQKLANLALRAPQKCAVYFTDASLNNPSAPTLEQVVSRDNFALMTYAQKTMAYAFLNTLQYREAQKQISHELCEITSVFLITSFVGNKINYLIDFAILDEITKLENSQAIKIMTSHLFISRGNMNWIYAQNCPNLHQMQPDARATTLMAVATEQRFDDGIKQCETALNQWKYMCNHIYGNIDTPVWQKDRTDRGLYAKSRADIERRLTKRDILRQTYSQFF